MFTFSQYILILESHKDTAVICFGRFQGLQEGHLKLLKKIVEVARQKDGMAMAFTSHTQDAKKNPLSYEQKLKYLKAAAPSGLEVVNSDAKTLYQVCEALGKQGFKHIIIICGSDRVPEFQKVNQYKDDYGLDSVEVVSAGERDPDADGVTGMSGSKMREYAKNDDFTNFEKGCALKGNLAKQMFNDIKQGMSAPAKSKITRAKRRENNA